VRQTEREAAQNQLREEGFVSILLDELYGFGGGFSVGVHEVIAIGFDNDKGIAAYRAGLSSIGIVLQSFTIA
jgi:hypothetical protein